MRREKQKQVRVRRESFRTRVLASAMALSVVGMLVAAAGNAGPKSKPLYPAAYDGVIAVTSGWLATNLRKNCAQLRASNSAAHDGTSSEGTSVTTDDRSPGWSASQNVHFPFRLFRRA